MKDYSIPEQSRVLRRKVPMFSSHFDMLRGVAALVVMLGHLKFLLIDLAMPSVANESGFVAPLQRTTNPMNPAHEAVILFFVLSGLFVGGAVMREEAEGRFQWTTYLNKRLSRLLTVLVPALLLGLLLDTATKLIIGRNPALFPGSLLNKLLSLGWRSFAANLLFLQALDRTQMRTYGSNDALWSLSFEFWYYILFPIAVGIFLRRLRGRRWVYAATGAVLAYFLWEDALTRFPLWLMGAGVSQLPAFIPERLQKLAVGVGATQFLVSAGYMWSHPPANLLVGDVLLAASFAFFATAILHRKIVVPKNAYSMIAERLANCSFSVYLFHLPVITLIGASCVIWRPELVIHRSLGMLLIGLITFAACYGLSLLFEAHTSDVRKFGERLLHLRKETQQQIPV
jgi:peptidoglycan/LPS O-acetylase OafA/YrhL